MNAIGCRLPKAAPDGIVAIMAVKKQKRLNIHWSPEWDEKIVTKAKQVAIGKDISFSAFVAEAIREKLILEGALPPADKPKKK